MMTTKPPFTRARDGRVSLSGQRQRGAIGLMATLTLLMAFAFLALTIDTGRIWFERRQLQKVADSAAMAAARYTGCGGSQTLVQKAATDSASANGFSTATDGSATITAQYGTLKQGANKETVFVPVSSPSDNTYAATVKVSKDIPTSIVLGGMFTTPLTLTAEATARGGPPTTAFTSDAQIFSVQAFSDAWNKAFKSNPITSPALYQQLAASHISVADLMKAAGYTSLTDFLNSSMTVQDLLNSYYKAAATGQADPATLATLSLLVNAAGTNGTQIPISKLLSLNNGTTDTNSLLSANVSVLGLLNTSVGILTAQSVIDLGVSAGDIAGVRLKLGDIPPLAVGPGGRSAVTGLACTKVTSREMTLAISVSPTKSSSILAPIFNVIKLVGITITADLEIGIHLGNATANVDYIEPVAGTAHSHFNVDTSLVRITYTKTDQPDNVPGEFSIKLLGLTIGGITIGTPADNTRTITATSLDIPVTTPIYESNHLPAKPTAASSGFAGTIKDLGSSVPAVKATIVGFTIDISLITNAIMSLVVDILAPLFANTIDPVLRALGINFGAANVTVYNLDNLEPTLVH